MILLSTALIAPEKLKNYLLVAKKRNDKSKWLAEAGYTLENWQLLENDLRTQILCLDAVPTDETKYGQLYETRGTLTGPNGKKLLVCAIWMIEYGSRTTKFITLFPDKRRS